MAPFRFGLADDENGFEISVYQYPGTDQPYVWARAHQAIIRLASVEELDAFINLLQATKKEIETSIKEDQ